MAEKKNTSFTGVQVAEVEADGEILQASWDDVVGDMAYMRDVIDGSDGTNYLKHDGAGAGARLGVPYVNQFFPIADYDEGAWIFSHTSYIGAYLLMYPFWAPRGEDKAHCEIKIENDTVRPFLNAVVMNSSFAVQSRTLMEWDNDKKRLYAYVDTDDSAINIIAFELAAEAEGNPGSSKILSVFIGPRRIAPAGAMVAGDLTYRTDSDDGAKPFLLNTTTASSATVIDYHGIDTAQAAIDRPLDAWQVAEAAGNQNALREHLTGLPVGHNLTHTLADSSSRGAFYRASGELSGGAYVNGRRHGTPIYCEALGSVDTTTGGDWASPGEGATAGANDTFPAPLLYTVGAVSAQTISRPTCYLPNIPSDPAGTGDEAVDGAIIVAAKVGSKSTGCTITGKILTSAGNATGTAVVGSGREFMLISITGVPFTQGAAQYVDMSIAVDGGNGGDDIMVLGWGFWVSEE